MKKNEKKRSRSKTAGSATLLIYLTMNLLIIKEKVYLRGPHGGGTSLPVSLVHVNLISEIPAHEVNFKLFNET